MNILCMRRVPLLHQPCPPLKHLHWNVSLHHQIVMAKVTEFSVIPFFMWFSLFCSLTWTTSNPYVLLIFADAFEQPKSDIVESSDGFGPHSYVTDFPASNADQTPNQIHGNVPCHNLTCFVGDYFAHTSFHCFRLFQQTG